MNLILTKTTNLAEVEIKKKNYVTWILQPMCSVNLKYHNAAKI